MMKVAFPILNIQKFSGGGFPKSPYTMAPQIPTLLLDSMNMQKQILRNPPHQRVRHAFKYHKTFSHIPTLARDWGEGLGFNW